MRQPLHGNRLGERIGHDDFVLARRRGIAVERRFHVRLQNLADVRQLVEKFHGEIVRLMRDVFFVQAFRRLIFQAFANFIFERSEDRVQQRCRFSLDFGRMNRLLVEKSGEQQPQQINRDGGNGALGRKIFAVEMVDAAHFGVGRDELVGELRDGVHGGKLT